MCNVKVKSDAKISSVAGAIAHCVRSACYVDVIAVGVPAIANAVRAVTVARWYLNGEQEIVFIPVFRTITGSRGNRRAVVLIVVCVDKLNDADIRRHYESEIDPYSGRGAHG